MADEDEAEAFAASWARLNPFQDKFRILKHKNSNCRIMSREHMNTKKS